VKATPGKPARRSRAGQTMVEYVLAFVVLIGLAFALAALGGALRDNGDRSVSLASSEYP
jgi:Flp pilus assembly protein TadG